MLSAVEGLRIVAPGLEPVIVPATVVILAGLFSIQSRGSGGLGRYFGPVMALWLGTALVLGVVHVIERPEVLTALSPHHGIEFLLREKFAAFRALGGVVLSVTGGEALYADMGHFGRRPIRIGWLTVRAAGARHELSRPGRVAPRRPGSGASAVLRDGARRFGQHSVRRPRHGRHGHRVAGADLRRVLARLSGDPARLLPAG